MADIRASLTGSVVLVRKTRRQGPDRFRRGPAQAAGTTPYRNPLGAASKELSRCAY
ncbi:hypothetical protein ACNUDN_02809 [Mycobacterium sp. smrl_JER01]